MITIRRSRALVLGMIALALSACDAGPERPAASPRDETAPLSIVLVTLDTVRADALGTYGQTLPASPEIDRLAAEGAAFETCVTSSPSTLPSHASILTGLQPYVHGARANVGYALPAEHETLAELLRANGYRTSAEVASEVIGRYTRLDQGFDAYRDPSAASARRNVVRVQERGGLREVSLQERNARDITRRGLEFVRSNRERPFFLWLHYYDPHRAWTPPEEFQALLPQSPYHAEIRFVDHQLGLLRREIERLGLRERVLIVVTADHGEGLGEHGESTHSYFIYDSTMRVPLVLWAPGRVSPGVRVAPLVRTIDVLPTILDFAGLPAANGVQGRSLRPLLQPGAAEPRHVAYGESIDLHLAFGSAVLRFVREGDWKYIHKVNPQLFHVARDPGELQDLAGREPERVEAMRERLRELLDEAPTSSSSAHVDLDDDTLDRLAALGYAATGNVASEDALASLELDGPDPAGLIGDVARMGEGWGQMRAERYERAAEIFESVLADHPDNVRAIDGLVSALLNAGRDEEAIPALHRAIEIAPSDLRYYSGLGMALLRTGEAEEAERVLRAATEVDGCASESRVLLAALLSLQRRHADQIAVLRAGIDACEDPSPLWNDAAYALATAPDSSLRDGDRAVELAELAATHSGNEDPGVLDTLAVAYAESGDFARAREASRRAIALLERQGAPSDVMAPYRARLSEIEAGRAIREGG